MSWRCQLFVSREAVVEQFGFVPVGAMWPDPSLNEREFGGYAGYIGDNYLRDWAGKRAPLYVKLPDGSEFCVDVRSSPEIGKPSGSGWKVTGNPPAITVSPSINIIPRYHGWLQNGVITDDCEGRTFPNARGLPT